MRQVSVTGNSARVAVWLSDTHSGPLASMMGLCQFASDEVGALSVPEGAGLCRDTANRLDSIFIQGWSKFAKGNLGV